MLPHRTSLAMILAVTLVTGAALADEGKQDTVTRDRGGEVETRVFVVEHIDTKTAVTLLRSTLNVRQIAEIPKNRRLVITDDADRLAAISNLLAQTDVPAPRWQAELTLVNEKGEHSVRRFDVEREEVTLQYTGALNVMLAFDAPTDKELTGDYRIAVSFRDDDSLNYQESGRLTVSDGERLVVFAPTSEAHRRDLARAVGMSGEARGLFLRFQRLR
jgi:type II secretory pathway component GspD/PulD (secretin)